MENRISDMNSLYDAFLASMKGSSWKEEVQRFETDFLSQIAALHKELDTREYKTSKGTEFQINERGKFRYIHGSRIRDRVVRHALCDEELSKALQPYLIYNNGASQKGKGISFSRNMFERDLHNYWLEHRSNDGWVGFVDLSKFYDNIQHDVIKELVYPKLNESTRWLMDEILSTFEIDVSYMNDEEYANCMNTKFDSVEYNNTVPKHLRTGTKMMAKSVDIGDQISQCIGVYLPTRIDNVATIVRGCKRYGRYMDDIYIIGETKEYIQSIISSIEIQATKLGFFVNYKKTRIVKLSSTYKYLQIKYTLSSSGKVIKRINPNTVTRERRKIKSYKSLLDKGGIEYETIEQAVRSWMGSYYRLMSKQQIKNMKLLYNRLFGKELQWKTRL